MKNYSHIIITGCARTGTTALVKLLSRQRDLLITNEFGTYNHWDNIEGWRNFADFREDSKFLKENREVFNYKGLDFDVIRQTIIEKRLTRAAIFKWLNVQHNLKGDKCPLSYLKNITKFNYEFPNAKFIITHRDGRDVIASQIRNYKKYGWSYAGWMQPTIEDASPLWLEASKLIVDILAKINSDKIFFFKYEDAVDRTEGFCKALSDFIGSEIVNHDKEYHPVNIGVWQRDLPDIMNVLSPDFKNMLKRFGY